MRIFWYIVEGIITLWALLSVSGIIIMLMAIHQAKNDSNDEQL